MKEKLRQLLCKEKIKDFGCLPLTHAKIIHPYLLPKDAKTAIILVVPYDLGINYSDGVSAYAHIRDYHRYFSNLFDRLFPILRAEFPEETFYGFADHSPIAEKDAAAKAGLGILGRNTLLIHPEYGSYVFLGSVITSMEPACDIMDISYCSDCGKCKEICPAKAITQNGINASLCLSAISQKKKLTDEESKTLRENHIAWGCDRCQTVCPHNQARKHTDIPYFVEQRHGAFCSREVEHMSEDEFLQYAFSWRGKDRIVQNLQNLVEE